MDSRAYEKSLTAAQLVAAATLLRSIAFDRWITVLMSVLLLVGATSARRGRVWGVGLALAAAASFPAAWLLGMAPFWFCAVGLLGALPFVHTAPAMARHDRGATTLLALLALSAGAAIETAWRLFAPAIFATFPSLSPSVTPQNGVAVAAVAAALGAAAAFGARAGVRKRAAGTSGVRVSVAGEAADEVDEVALDDATAARYRAAGR